ncbi:sialidase family protein [Longimicrobium terrae]|nr:sialidase family protein [Longimicrobium terrae]
MTIHTSNPAPRSSASHGRAPMIASVSRHGTMIAIVLAALAACTGETAPPPPMATIAVPAAAGSGMYTLTQAPDAESTLSWVQSDSVSKTSVLRASTFRDGGWTAPRTISTGTGWFLNWADRPSVTGLPGGATAAHWLETNPGTAPSAYTYGIKVAYSADGGANWKRVHHAGRGFRGKNQYTGFLSFLPGRDGFLAAYLTPPAEAAAAPSAHSAEDHEHRMTLRVAEFGPGGQLRSDVQLDSSTCTCCPLGMAQAEAGPVVVYRDRWPGEVRDVSIIRRVNGRWTEPRPVHRDGWVFPGCPTNGPVVAAKGRRVAVAWFTGVDDRPEVRLAFSADGGETFGAPVRISATRAVGYAGLVMLEDGGAAVSWMEAGAGSAPALRIRRVSPDGKPGSPVQVAAVAGGRSGGMPQLGRSGDGLLLVWKSGQELRSAIVPVARLGS